MITGAVEKVIESIMDKSATDDSVHLKVKALRKDDFKDKNHLKGFMSILGYHRRDVALADY